MQYLHVMEGELPGGDVCGRPNMGDLCWKAVDWACPGRFGVLPGLQYGIIIVCSSAPTRLRMHDNIYANPGQYPGLHAGHQSDLLRRSTKLQESPALQCLALPCPALRCLALPCFAVLLHPCCLLPGASSFQEFQCLL